MNWKNLIYCLLGCLVLTACYDEEPLTPTDSEGMGGLLRFEFPQGNNSWDDDIVEIQEKFGIYLIYDDVDSTDLNRKWTSDGGSSMIQGQGAISDEQVEYTVNFLKNHIFDYLTPEILKGILPMYCFITYDLHVMYIWGPSLMKSTEGMDFWAYCYFWNESNYDDYVLVPSAMETEEEYWAERISILSGFIKKSLNEGNIAVPDEFQEGFDYTTEIVFEYGMESDPNYYLNRGLPGTFYGPTYESYYGLGFYPSKLSLGQITPTSNFLSYLQMAMWKTEADLNEMWPKVSYPFLWEKRAFVIDYMKSEYNIDLEAIAAGPAM